MSNSPQPNGAGINGEKSSRTTIFNQGQGQVGIPSELNGHSRTNGEVSKVSHSHDAFREAAMSSTDLTQGPLAPEIEHITQGYQPLAKLITRVTQDTYKELLEVIDKMAEMDPHQPSAPNHFDRNARTNGNGSIESQVNIDKKMLLMNLVQKRRAQFIKLFVLAQWSRQSEEVSRLIDLKIWLDKQMGLHDECIFWMGDLRRSLEPAKVPNPDLETALRVLSTGKVPSVPDLGYTTPPPPTPQQILKTLRNINTLLQIRLNLHEHLPPYFKTFTIKSGRATFVVPEEFEVDLSIAKEDIESQFYFIDLRLLFSPIASGLPEGQWRAQFEEDCNVILKTQGLAGLYHHLHEFILTTKINLLRRQAIEMSRRKWIETLHVEMLRRLLVVQYWVGKPGPKHWIEISVLSGKQMDEQGNVKSQGPSYLDIRWARDGQRLPGSPPIKLDCQNLTMENILNAIIGLHVKHILLSTRAKLMETKLYATSALALSAKISKKEPADSFLSIQLLPLVTSTISIQPILGSFAFQPSTPLARRAEGDLNTLPDPAGQAYSRIFNARCLMTQEAIEFQAAKLQWNIIRNLRFKQEELKRTFSRDTLQISYFRSEGWSPNWILAVSIGMRAEEWWILEINQSTSNPTILVGRRVPIILPSSKAPKIDTPLLTMISIAAAGICSQYTNIRVLENSKIPYRLLPQTTPRSSPLSPYSSFPTLLISFYHLMKLHRSPTNQYGAWARDVLAIRYRGLSAYSGKSVAIIETRILYPKAFAGISTQSIDKDIAFHPKSGGIAIRLRAQIGVSIIQQLYGRLRRIERILSFVMVIKRFHLKTTKISLSHVAFLYASSPSLTAEISLDGNAPMALTFNENNPHHLLIDHLTHLLNSHTRFEPVIISLALTLALCRALITLMADETVGDIAVLPRSSLEILLKYQRAGIAFDMRLRKRRKEMLWYICQDKRGPPTDESLKSELKKIFEDSGEGWIGLDTAIAASSTGVEEVIGKLHAAVRAHVTQKKAKSNDKIDEKSGIKNQKLVGLD